MSSFGSKVWWTGGDRLGLLGIGLRLLMGMLCSGDWWIKVVHWACRGLLVDVCVTGSRAIIFCNKCGHCLLHGLLKCEELLAHASKTLNLGLAILLCLLQFQELWVIGVGVALDLWRPLLWTGMSRCCGGSLGRLGFWF